MGKLTEADKAKAFKLYEEVKEYFLSWALDGEFYPDHMVRADAAFATHDADTLAAIAAELRTSVDFVEPNDILPKLAKDMKPVEFERDGKKLTRKFRVEDFTIGERLALLRVHPGTRAYAQAQIDKNVTAAHPFG